MAATTVSPTPLLKEELDIVIPTIRNLDFLEMWRPFFQPYHVIIVQDGDPNKTIKVPEGFDYELYNRNDINRILGPKTSCISFKDSASRCFGFLVSKKKYIFTIDDDCFVAEELSGKKINALEQHIKNLLSPSTPFPVPIYQNTLPIEDGMLHCTTVQKCYIELSKQVKAKLGKVDDYFNNLADAMLTWIEAWDELNQSRNFSEAFNVSAK
ncbi:hypothetical protein K2173_002434 [Erythroxylum novogranatense]|uniref:Uncharacterized protein n=1 Tax=Erythroxylum novogranatense TaxID=1862640 RepID=A0AAV8T9X6_9ROSI|nr:hypothetical protein K2173_002434 [Erythroxylum novogranatense]